MPLFDLLLRRVRAHLHISFTRAVSGAALVHTAGLLINLLLSIVLARTLGLSALGLYASAYALLTWLTVVCCLGIPRLIICEIPRSFALQQYGLVSGVLSWSFIAIILLTALTALGFSLFAVWSDVFPPHTKMVYLAAAGMLPLVSLLQVQRAALQGFEQGFKSLIPDTLVRPGAFSLLLLFTSTFSIHEASSVLLLHTASALFSVGIGWAMVRGCYPTSLRHAQRQYRTKQWARSAFSMSTANISSITMAQIGLTLLPQYASAEAIGLYRVAVSAAALVSIPLVAVNVPLPPAAARLYSLRKEAALRQLVTLSARLAVLGSMPIIILLIFLGPSILSLLFGDNYAGAYFLLCILLIGQVFNVLCGSCGYLLQVCGFEKTASRAFVFAMAVQVVLLLFIAPRYGVIGVAVAQSFGLSLVNFVLMIGVIRHLKLDPTALGWSVSYPSQHKCP